MTASPRRRHRATVIGGVTAVISVLLVAVLSVLGATTLADSEAGRDAGAGRSSTSLVLPSTPAALLGVVDGDGVLTGAAVLVLRPDGRGGSVIVIPPTASAWIGDGDVHPLAETWLELGASEFVLEAEALTGISFDLVEVVTADRLAELLGPVGTIEVIVPEAGAEVIDAATGSSRFLGPRQIAADLTRRVDQGPDSALDPYRAAVWQAVGAAVSATGEDGDGEDGDGEDGDGEDGDGDELPATVDELLTRMFSGPVAVWAITTTEVPVSENRRNVDAVKVDPAELLLVFAHIAPARVAAPNVSYTFRIESRFTDEQLEPYGVTNADIAREVVEVLLFVQANVVSVETTSTGAPEKTIALVSDPELLRAFDESWPIVFGEVEVVAAETEIARVDATIVLGEQYLTHRLDFLGGNR